ERLGVPDVRPRRHDRAVLRARRTRVREGALARDLPDGRLRPRDARHRDGVHHRWSVVARPARHLGLRRRDPDLHGRLALGLPLVAGARGGRHVPDRRVRVARGEADLLGLAVTAFPSPRGRARTGVGCSRHPRRRARALWIRAGYRPHPGRHRHRAVAGENPSAMIATPYVLELGLAALMLLVFVIGVLGRRPVAAPATAGVFVLTAAALALAPSGTALGGMFVQDGLAIFVKRVFLAATFIGLLSGLGSPDRAMARRSTEYHLLLLASLLGMLVLASARDLIVLFVAFELMSIPLYVLTGFAKREAEPVEASLKFFLVGSVSSAVIAYGLSFVYGATGSTSLAAIAKAPASPLLTVGLIAALAGLAFKIAAFPFHMWVPDAYEAGPTPFVAWLSVAPKAAGFVTLFRVYFEGVGDRAAVWAPAAAGLATLTML